MKDRLRRLVPTVGIMGLCAIFVLLIFLMIEVRFFWKQARELITIKEQYANYVLGFKRMIAEHHSEPRDRREEDLEAGQKKKRDETADAFLVVNRDPGYLRNQARRYARLQGIEESWAALRDETAIVGKKKKQRVRRNVRYRRVMQHVQRIAAPDSDVMALARDCAFSVPLERGSFWLSSPFGPRRKRNGVWGFHYGLDMAAPHGTPVKAVAQGVVVEACRSRGFGNTVVVSHSNKLKTRYAHLSRIDVSVGDTVERGQRVGRVGNTGNTRGRNGVHLHIEVLVYGKRVNPLHFFSELRSI